MPQIAPLPSGLKIGKRFRVPPVSKMRGRTPTWLYIFTATSALLAIVAVGGALAWSRIFDSVLASQLKLAPNSRSYQNWVAPTVPLYFDIYLFNWTNPEMFPEKPAFDQIGPFSYREERVHVNVTFNENGTMSYRTHRRWYFDEDRSRGNLDDQITSINGVAASAAYRARSWGYLQQKGLSMGLTMFNQQFSVTKTASELLFEGYHDPLLDLAKSLPASTTGGAPPVDKFGWFYGRNDTLDTDGYMEVTTGQHRGSFPGQIVRWNYEDHLPYYSGECSKLLGSAGEFVSRNLTEESVLKMFVPDLCRTVNMDYVESGEVEGLNYHKYALSPRSFDNSTVSHANTCFCNGSCAWGGVMNVSACRYGSPAFLSLPHFLYGDELRSLVDGMYPDPELHDFYFAVEPKLGVPVEVAARFQLNMFIDTVENVDLYSNAPRMLFPIFWVEQKVQMESRVLEELRYVRAILDWGAVVCACAALFFAILVTIATCWARKPQYLKTELLPSFEKPKDEAELKLNPK